MNLREDHYRDSRVLLLKLEKPREWVLSGTHSCACRLSSAAAATVSGLAWPSGLAWLDSGSGAGLVLPRPRFSGDILTS